MCDHRVRAARSDAPCFAVGHRPKASTVRVQLRRLRAIQRAKLSGYPLSTPSLVSKFSIDEAKNFFSYHPFEKTVCAPLLINKGEGKKTKKKKKTTRPDINRHTLFNRHRAQR